MIERIREYLERAFAHAPQTAKVLELKEELFANLVDKYQDQLNNGASEEEAYNVVIGGIGDISDLIASMEEPRDVDAKRRRAAITAVAVALYILSPFLFLVGEELFHLEMLGMFLFFGCIAVATAMLIYVHMTKPETNPEETMVEDFKKWRRQSARSEAAQGSLRSAFWLIVVVIYFGVSFYFGIWGYSWLIFIIGAAIDRLVSGLWHLKEDGDE
ncbi:permease prefix domain 1-containing protein [Gehongia tenuis]|uniref:Uncharacterized protein n=1 Tax=Gehongia tenuis TaxID=2763655 RepID=A0A926HPP8_9FIRM|nr:permease prefix domain 1-containing protein [Gehongia tenuis]MBC8531889.1 hypothetical protein [Gehongia tenuis]